MGIIVGLKTETDTNLNNRLTNNEIINEGRLRSKIEKKYRKAIEAECQFREQTGELMGNSYKCAKNPLYHKVQMLTCEIKKIFTEEMKIEEQLADEMIKSRMRNDRIAAGVASYVDYEPVNVDDIINCTGRFRQKLINSAKEQIKRDFLVVGMDLKTDGHLFVQGESLFNIYNEDGELDGLCDALYERIYEHPYLKLHPEEGDVEVGELLEKVLPYLKLKQEELNKLLKEVIFGLEREFYWEVPDCYSKLKYVAVVNIVYNPAGNSSVTAEATAIAATKNGVAQILDYIKSIGGDILYGNKVFEATVLDLNDVQPLL